MHTLLGGTGAAAYLLTACAFRRTRSALALLKQNEARSGQHALLSGGQAPAGLSLRQVADYLDDLDQIP